MREMNNAKKAAEYEATHFVLTLSLPKEPSSPTLGIHTVKRN